MPNIYNYLHAQLLRYTHIESNNNCLVCQGNKDDKIAVYCVYSGLKSCIFARGKDSLVLFSDRGFFSLFLITKLDNTIKEISINMDIVIFVPLFPNFGRITKGSNHR